jgi:hypothetical protein
MNRTVRSNMAAALVGAAVTASLVGLAAGVGWAGAAHATSGATDANGGVGMYGDPAAAAPFWRPQHSGDCAEMAVADVVGQITGHEPTERQITSLAEKTPSTTSGGPIYHRRGGTDIDNVPVLLAHYGIQSSLDQPTIGGLEQDLAQRHKVIAAVNAETIWNSSGNRNVDDHVVVVTGIDANAGVVHLNDSGIRSGRDEQVSLSTFEKAWATSHNLAVVTS